ncbi:AAA family ATPase [Teichococcus coralli]|nr:hypothetical protein [Pseudoroseomonas coralli]
MLHRRHDELVAQAAAIAPDDAVLAQAESIASLLEAAGATEKARQDLPGLEAELRSQRTQIDASLRALGLSGPASRAAEAIPAAISLAQARRLLRTYVRHAEALATLPSAVAEQEAALNRAEAALASLPPPRDAEVLAALISSIAAEGDPVRMAAAAAQATAQAAARLDALLARLPAAWRDLDWLHAVEAPQPSLLRQRAEHRRVAGAAHGEQVAVLERLQGTLTASRQERAQLNREGPLPGAAVLTAARARRDAGWNLIYRRAFSGEAPDTRAEQAFGAEQPLPLAYVAAVVEVDRLADLRNREAERVSAAEQLDRAILQQEEGLATARIAEAAARRQAEAAEAAWAALLHPLALAPRTEAPELEQLLALRTAALEEAANLILAREAEKQLLVRQAADACRLRQVLGGPRDSDPDLRALLAEAEARQRETRRTESDRARLQEQREAARESLAAAERALATAREQMAGWHADWKPLAARLGRAPDEHPEDSAEALRLFEELAPIVREADRLAERITAIGAEIAAFTTRCSRLAEELGTAASRDPVAAARALGQRLQAARGAAERRTLLALQAEEAAASLAAGMRQAEADAAELRAVIAATGADSAEAAEERLDLSNAREHHENLLAEAQQEIFAGGDGLSLETLCREVEALAPEMMEAELLRAREALTAQQAAAEHAAADAAHAEAALQALSNETAFSRAVQDQQTAVTQAGETLENALLLHTASLMLELALGAAQEAGDDRLLRRIGATFALLTNGAYPSVTSREDEKGVAHLVIRRADYPDEETLVDELSEGTRDQLFLALRLVAIEDHVAQGAILPFLGDDILQSFDDGRAAAAFHALLDFSRTTQVILLSHHQHLLDLARATLAPEQVHVQRLEG